MRSKTEHHWFSRGNLLAFLQFETIIPFTSSVIGILQGEVGTG